MRLLHVVPSYFPAVRYGGPIYSVHALCAALARAGHDVHVFTTNVDGELNSPVPIGVPTNLDGVNVTYFETSTGRRLYRSSGMNKSLRRVASSFDVIHLHSVFLLPTTMAARAARRAGVPYVISPRGMLVKALIRQKSRISKAIWIRAFERKNLEKAAALHVTSSMEASELAQFEFNLRRIAVIPNGIDVPSRDLGPTSAEGEPTFTFLSLGRINWKKGLERIIDAIGQVPSARLVVAGNDEDGIQSKLEDLAKDRGVSHQVCFVGPVWGKDKWDLMAGADVFVLPSYSENFGIAVLEAMACGVPVIVTPEVGLAATVSKASAGLVVQGGAESLGQAMKHLFEHPEECRRMGMAGRQVALEEFGWDSIASSMADLYQQLAGGGTAGRAT